MASNMFLKITGPDIKGESTDSAHTDEIEISNFQHGLSMAVGPRSTAGSATTEKASHADVSVMKVVDKATPEIQKGICNGQHFTEVKITINKTTSASVVPYLVYTLNDVVITSSSISGSEGGGLAMEAISMNYGKIKWDYAPTNPADGTAMGTVPFAWDVGQNKVV